MNYTRGNVFRVCSIAFARLNPLSSDMETIMREKIGSYHTPLTNGEELIEE